MAKDTKQTLADIGKSITAIKETLPYWSKTKQQDETTQDTKTANQSSLHNKDRT